MKTIFSTAILRPQDRFDAWHEIACREVYPHGAIPHDRMKFDAELQFGQLDKVSLMSFSASSMGVERHKAHIAKATDDDLLLMRFQRGRYWIDQDEQQFEPTPGDLVLFDPMAPYRMGLDGPDGCEGQLMMVPRRALAERLGSADPSTARLIEANGGDAGMLSAWLALRPRFVTDNPDAERDANYLLDLLASSLAPAEAPIRISSAAHMMLSRMDQFIDDRLGDPALSRDEIAGFVGVSVRHLNRLLADADRPNITEMLLSRRLVCARRLLADPRSIGRTVLEIAMLCGFTDPTHFGRAFKNTYGLLPRDFRALAIATRSQSAKNTAALRQRVPVSR